jgi:L-serine/L-threonine ammonia-lyase
MLETNGLKHIKGSPKQVFIRTPLLHSAPLSNFASQCGKRVDVYLKMEALQPSGSFKVRGLGNSILKAYDSTKGPFHIISSSGGNAGLAAAYCARQMEEPCTIFVPSTCEEFVKDLLRAEGASVIVAGPAWDECDLAAKELLQQEKSAGRMAYYVHPFEGEDTVEGHSTMMDEIVDQLQQVGIQGGRPDIVTCSAGGSGLIRGIMKGIHRAFKQDLPQIIVTQTFGANSLGSSITQAREKGQKWDDEEVVQVSLPSITSKATSLGAKTCSLQAVKEGLEYGERFRSLIIEDRMAEDAAWRKY